MKILKLIFVTKKTHSEKVFPLWPDQAVAKGLKSDPFQTNKHRLGQKTPHSAFFSRFLFIRNLQQKGHAQNSTQQITSTPYIGRRRYRTHRRAICALCLAEMTLVRA